MLRCDIRLAALHTANMGSSYYERIGVRYSATRRPDSRIADVIFSALGDAESVVNVGAGTGSYEPTDRRVVAVDPSRVMLAQRASGTASAVQAVAESLPFPDDAFEAAMAVLTLITTGRTRPAALRSFVEWRTTGRSSFRLHRIPCDRSG
jgi:ubiquinone/menaquinone biosynthesis C-methylase UbiE